MGIMTILKKPTLESPAGGGWRGEAHAPRLSRPCLRSLSLLASPQAWSAQHMLLRAAPPASLGKKPPPQEQSLLSQALPPFPLPLGEG